MSFQSALLRCGRVTRFLPRFPVNPAHRLYRRILNPRALYRISNFDGTLTLDVNMVDAVGATLWHVPHRFEKRERLLFCSAVKPGSSVLDVGANLGIYTLLAARRGARVFAIEADPQNAIMLKRHVNINGFGSQVTVYEMTALDQAGAVTLHRNPTNSGGSSLWTGGAQTASVSAQTIDSLHLPPIDVCKMDIEGSELSALLGMRETLMRSQT
jgi:FkbM family methyltransferase